MGGGRTGTLWEGRYKASLVDSGRYFLACSRHVELNPVRDHLQQQKVSGSGRFRAWVEARTGRFAAVRPIGVRLHVQIVPGTFYATHDLRHCRRSWPSPMPRQSRRSQSSEDFAGVMVAGGGADRFAAASRRARRASVIWPCRNNRSVQRELMGVCGPVGAEGSVQSRVSPLSVVASIDGRWLKCVYQADRRGRPSANG